MEKKTFAYAAAQTKKCLEVGKRLGAANHVFWGGREGYQSTLNTDVKRELDHLAAFFKMVIAYKEKIGFNAQCLIEPKPREPTKHQYDYDAQTVIGFLHKYNHAILLPYFGGLLAGTGKDSLTGYLQREGVL